ncbi:MAG: S1C family serine protease, partial [Nitrospinota bacterium]
MNGYLQFVADLLPAVVNIHARIPRANPSSNILGTERMGTGTLLDAEGHILTIGYIVLGAHRIRVNLSDGRSFSAHTKGYNVESGLAVVQLDGVPRGEPLPAAALGDSTSLEVGQNVLIAAATEASDRQVTTGIVSALGPFDAYWEYMLDRAILTTASNPGFGGGPLLDYRGKLVGVVSLNLGPGGGMTLAVPLELYFQERDELLDLGGPARAPRPWLGVYSQPHEQGLLVVGVVPESPADEADVEEGDAIIALNSERFESRREFYERLWQGRAGDMVSLALSREGRDRTVLVQSMDRKIFYRR